MNGKHLTPKIFKNKASTFCVRWKCLAKDCTAAMQDAVFGEDLLSLPNLTQHMGHTEHP